MDTNENKFKSELEQSEKKLMYPVKEKSNASKEKIYEEKINKIEFSFYTSLVLMPFILLMIMVISSLLEYSRWPIYTETNITPQNEANFPAMTFCPAHSGYKEHILMVSFRIPLFSNID